LASACRLDRTYYDKITASVGPLLEKLNTGAIAELLSPIESESDSRPIFNWLEVIKNKKIVYVGMDALTDNVISSTVGNAMLSDLVSVAMDCVMPMSSGATKSLPAGKRRLMVGRPQKSSRQSKKQSTVR
jgi:hypothetical protein